mmetsp:Transcript_58118/g.165183  ORF Transcript_58118/g.165183 Transcript_58118/m.165183 type:complete len:206 (-) Transcript_58118:478-1095(-)
MYRVPVMRLHDAGHRADQQRHDRNKVDDVVGTPDEAPIRGAGRVPQQQLQAEDRVEGGLEDRQLQLLPAVVDKGLAQAGECCCQDEQRPEIRIPCCHPAGMGVVQHSRYHLCARAARVEYGVRLVAERLNGAHARALGTVGGPPGRGGQHGAHGRLRAVHGGSPRPALAVEGLGRDRSRHGERGLHPEARVNCLLQHGQGCLATA